jgi:hypothetical protein
MSDEREPQERMSGEYVADIELFNNWEELEPPDWITDLDRDILAILGNSGLIMTPAIIAKNIDRPRSSVSNRLSTLEAGEMVEKVERGHYKISDKGYSMMTQKITADIFDGPEEYTSITVPTSEQLDEIE